MLVKYKKYESFDDQILKEIFGEYYNNVIAVRDEQNPVEIKQISALFDSKLKIKYSYSKGSILLSANSKIDDNMLYMISGYFHFICALRMKEADFPKEEVNEEIDKCCSLYARAGLYNSNPLMKDTYSFKRRYNMLGFSLLYLCGAILAGLVLLSAYIYRAIYDGSLDFL